MLRKINDQFKVHLGKPHLIRNFEHLGEKYEWVAGDFVMTDWSLSAQSVHFRILGTKESYPSADCKFGEIYEITSP